MKTLQQTLVCILLAALVSLALCFVLLVRAATKATIAVPVELETTRAELLGQLSRMLDGDPNAGTSEGRMTLRHLLLNEIDSQMDELRGELDRQVSKLQRNTFAELAEIRGAADRRAGDILSRVDTALKTADGRTGQVLDIAAGIRADLKPTLANTAAITGQANDMLPPFLNCDHNPDCVFNRYQGVSKAVEQTAKAVAKAAPEISKSTAANADNVAGITADVHSMTKAMLKPKSFWGKLWAGVSVLSRFAGLL